MPTPASGEPVTKKSFWIVIALAAAAVVLAVVVWMLLTPV